MRPALSTRGITNEIPPRGAPIRSADVLSPIAEEDSRDIDEDEADDEIAFDGLVTAEHWLAFDMESTYVVVDDEGEACDPTDFFPMRTVPDTQPDIDVTSSWLIAAALPEARVDFVEVSFPYFWSPVLTDIGRQATAG